MNARKHREVQQAIRDWLRLGPKGEQSGSGVGTSPDANESTAGVQSEPKSSRERCRTWKRCQPRPGLATGQTSPQGGSGGAALGGPKKPTPACNALDMPTSVWSETARKHAEPIRTEKANDDRHPSVDASQHCAQGSNSVLRLRSSIAEWCGGSGSRSVVLRVNPQAKSQGWPYEGLSRMKGNFQVRFLEGGGLATARLHSAFRLGLVVGSRAR